jgi:hypothetical protein
MLYLDLRTTERGKPSLGYTHIPYTCSTAPSCVLTYYRGAVTACCGAGYSEESITASWESGDDSMTYAVQALDEELSAFFK